MKSNLSAQQAGKGGKYLLYAIGEIILVMIGILLALQVNTWNQARINSIEEKDLISNLHDEFKENKELLSTTIEIVKGARNASAIVMKLMGASDSELAIHNLDSLFFESFPASQFTSSSQSINNIIQGGRMNIIKNKKIISLIYKWQAQVEATMIREQAVDKWTFDQMLPYLSKYISLKEMDSYGNYEWTGPSKLKKNYFQLFQSLEFENLLDNSLYLNLRNFDELEKANMIIDEIIESTKSYSHD